LFGEHLPFGNDDFDQPEVDVNAAEDGEELLGDASVAVELADPTNNNTRKSRRPLKKKRKQCRGSQRIFLIRQKVYDIEWFLHQIRLCWGNDKYEKRLALIRDNLSTTQQTLQTERRTKFVSATKSNAFGVMKENARTRKVGVNMTPRTRQKIPVSELRRDAHTDALRAELYDRDVSADTEGKSIAGMNFTDLKKLLMTHEKQQWRVLVGPTVCDEEFETKSFFQRGTTADFSLWPEQEVNEHNDDN
jgi:hypothetical protein